MYRLKVLAVSPQGMVKYELSADCDYLGLPETLRKLQEITRAQFPEIPADATIAILDITQEAQPWSLLSAEDFAFGNLRCVALVVQHKESGCTIATAGVDIVPEQALAIALQNAVRRNHSRFKDINFQTADKRIRFYVGGEISLAGEWFCPYTLNATERAQHAVAAVNKYLLGKRREARAAEAVCWSPGASPATAQAQALTDANTAIGTATDVLSQIALLVGYTDPKGALLDRVREVADNARTAAQRLHAIARQVNCQYVDDKLVDHVQRMAGQRDRYEVGIRELIASSTAE